MQTSTNRILTTHTGSLPRPVSLTDRTDQKAVRADCGFASAAGGLAVDPKIAWAKLAAMAEGARLASDHLWGHACS